MRLPIRFLPWMFLALFVFDIVAVILPKPDSDLHIRQFGRLPALLNGRVQPLDSVARNSLLELRGTSTVPLEEVPSWQFWHHARKLIPSAWLLEVMTRPERANERPVFLIHNPELLRTLRLEEQGIARSGLRYYTFNQVNPQMTVIEDLAAQFDPIDDKMRTPYQRQLLKLRNALVLYQRLQMSLQPRGTKDLAAAVADLMRLAPAGTAAARAQQAGGKFDAQTPSRFAEIAAGFHAVQDSALPRLIPPRDSSQPREQWVNFGTGVMDSVHQGELHPAVGFFAEMASAYCRDSAAEFNRAVELYQEWLADRYPSEARKAKAEFYFNDIQAFLHSMIIYLTAFLLAAGALLALSLAPELSESLRRSSVWLVLLAFVLHTLGLIYRMALEGRPPVTNLYSSAIFIGWGAVVLGLSLERVFKVGIGSAISSLAGFVTLIIAHNLALGGDTMQMLRAVLDTNFWLATHVTSVTIGYASTFVAGLLGIAYVFLGIFTPVLGRKHRLTGTDRAGAVAAGSSLGPGVDKAAQPSPAQAEGVEIGFALNNMIYGIVCFAMLFSFTGTVLGGIWADQSWGRFWGWDPKENGALIIVLWNALILHARWGGFVQARGLALMSIFGNIVTSFSWFGVNMLGIGLHSYGFMDAAFTWLLVFVASQAGIIVLGLLPLRFWRSFRTSTLAASATGSAIASDKDSKTSPAPVRA